MFVRLTVTLHYILQRLTHLEQSLTAEEEINTTLRKNLEDIQSNYFNASMILPRTLLDHVYELECRLIKHYTRWESIEIMGIPENIAHKDLEQSVLNIFHTICATDIKSLTSQPVVA